MAAPAPPKRAEEPFEDGARQVRFDSLIQDGLDDLAEGRSETADDVGLWLDGLGRSKPE